MNTKTKTIEFAIPYRVNEDAHLQLRYRLDSEEEGVSKVLPLVEVIRGEWSGALPLEEGADSLYYGYEYVRGGKVVRSEWNGQPHVLRMNSVNDRYMQNDRWLDSPAGYYMHTGLFRMFAPETPAADGSGVNWYNRSVTITLYVVGLLRGERPAIAGDAVVVGGWSPEKALPMHYSGDSRWSVTFDASELWSGRFSCKIIRVAEDGSAQWEEGENRTITLPDF